MRFAAERGHVDGLDGAWEARVVYDFSCSGIEGEEVLVLSGFPLSQDMNNVNMRDGETYSGMEAFSSSLMFSRLYSFLAWSSASSPCLFSPYGWVKAANVLAPFGTELCDARFLRCEASGVHFGRGSNRVVDGCDI